MKTLQERLKHARKEAFLTQAQLSDRSGLSQSTIAQIESGRNSGTRFADRLAKALGVSLSWLLTGEGAVSEQPLVPHPRRRAMDADEWLFLDLERPLLNSSTGLIWWEPLERGALRIHTSFFRTKGLQPKNCRVLVHHGSSLNPYLLDGDWCMIDTRFEELNEGVSAFIRDDGEHYVARIRKLPNGGFRLIDRDSTQPPVDFEPGVAEKTLKKLGEVVLHTSPLTYEYQLR